MSKAVPLQTVSDLSLPASSPFAAGLLGRSIGRRLLLGFALVLALCLIGSAVAVLALARIERDTETMLRDSVATERLASDWHRLIKAGVLRTTAVAVSSDGSLAEFFAADTAESSRQSAQLVGELEKRLTGVQERQLYEALGQRRQVYLKARDRIIQARRQGETELARQLFKSEFKPASEAYLDELGRLLSLQRQEIDQMAADLARLNQRARLGLLAFGLAATVLGLALSLRLSRSITVPLRQAEAAAEAIARFDLSSPLQGHERDEAGRLLLALARMQQSLGELVRQVRDATQSVATASQQIAAGNGELSQRTERTAHRLQSTASAVTQLSGSVGQTAESARSASRLAAQASQAARAGGEVAVQVISTMDGIDGSSRRIADIIGVIDGIAFQTNILALNAAVEAARAGEQGRGFAVVAGEVRGLAQRSAEAAREIKQLIAESVERVASGTALVRSAGQGMEEIMASVRRVNDIIGEISAAASEQNQSMNDVGQAVAHVDDMTQQNAALVEEAAAASSSLHEQAARLSQAVGVFRLQG
nr:methyl-accepting chemotaxis protein [Shinella sp. XGS7]